MTRHLHESANAVLYRALDLPTGDRQQFIAQATAGDIELFEDVRTMLSRIEQLDQFLEDPLELPVEQKAPAPVLPRHGDLVGEWKVEQELGRNGADLILLVQRDGRQGTMRLAQAASRSGQTITRFERLRERLATLHHAAVPLPVDGGATTDGRPYFVVERREGVPIDRFCAEGRLDLAERALLFAKVCEAVHYIHQHLIVHRDLKPADMLVSASGAITLLDVGMIGDGWPVNPAYASPDQLAGQPLSVSSDIYALGAVLYSLLTGSYAHGHGDGGVFTVADRVPVRAPSAALLARLSGDREAADLPNDPALAPSDALAAQLRTVFDPILALALAVDPAERYASAHALARDLRDAAASLQAQPEELVQQVAPIMMVEAAPIAAAAEAPARTVEVPAIEEATAAQLEPVAPAPRRSSWPLALAMLVAGFAGGVFTAPWLQQQGYFRMPTPASAPIAAPAVTPAAMVPAVRPAVRNAAVPPDFATALALADSRRAAGDLAGAQQAASAALELAATVPQSSRDKAGADANLRLGAILAEQGNTEDGLTALRKALALHESHAVMDAGEPVAARAAADVHRAIAEVLAGTGDDAGAETELLAARKIYNAQLAVTPADASLHTGLLSIGIALATAQNAQKHGRDTVATLAGLRRLAGAGGDARIDLLEAWVQPRGTAEKAYAAAKPALAQLRHASEHADTNQTRLLARALTMVGEVALRARQGTAACENFDEAAQLYQGLAASQRLNAYDKLAVQRLDAAKQACR